MDGENWFGFLLLLGGLLLLLIPALLLRRLLLDLTAWPFRALGRAFSKKPKPERVAPREEPASPRQEHPSGPRQEHQFVGLVARLLELPPAERVLSLLTGDGRGIQLVLDSERPLILRLCGSWTSSEEEAARALMRAEVDSRPDLARLLDPEDPQRGVVFTTENQYSASGLIYQLATEALRADPGSLRIEKDYEDPDARPEIAKLLRKHRAAEILHEESGVRVRVSLYGGTGYKLYVPTASLDPRRGHRHRARRVLTDAGWRLDDADLGSGAGSLDDSDESWGYSVDSGDAKQAADAALRLLCSIADAPLDVRVHPQPLR